MKGSIIQRSKGTWTLIFDLGRDGHGKRQQKWKALRGTRQDAERELRRVLRELDTGSYIEPSKISLSVYLNQWLRDYAKPNTAPTTYERYADIVSLHLIPALGEIALAKLQPLHIQAYYAEALQEGRRNGTGGLSARTVHHHHRILKQALAQAVKWQLLNRNVADAVTPPRPERHEMAALDEPQTVELIECTKSTNLYIPVFLAVTTGLRRGEVLGLRWSDVDLEAGVLSVRQALESTKNGLAFKQPKTVKSRRRVSLLPLTVQVLREHAIEQKKARLAAGPAYTDHGLVCARSDGSPVNPRQLSKDFLSLIRRNKLLRVRFHDLRHSHASQLLRQGIHPKIVSERLGHSSVAITLDTYSHVLPGMQEDAALSLDEVFKVAMSEHKENK